MPDDPIVVHAELLAGLLGSNDATARKLLASYAKLYRDLTIEWLSLLKEVEDARAAGGAEQAFQYIHFRTRRVEELRLQTARQIGAFATQAASMVAGEQGAAVIAAQVHAETVIAAMVRQVAPTVRTTFAMLPERALEDLVGRFSNGMPLARLFDDIGPSAAQGAYDVLFRAVATGVHPTVAARQLRRELGIPLTRALTISRTEMLGAYRAATLRAFNENDDLVGAWRWNANLGTACLACVALHGSVHPLTEAFADHVNGACVPSPILVPLAELGDIQGRVRRKAGLDQTGQDYWDGLSDAEKRRRLGPGKYALMTSGAIDLEDMVYEDNSPLWGIQYREASVAQSLSNHFQGGTKFTYQAR